MLRNVSGIVRGEGVEEEREKEGNEKGRRQAGGGRGMTFINQRCCFSLCPPSFDCCDKVQFGF